MKIWPLLLSLLWVCAGVGAQEQRFFILHTNDIHGHIEAYEQGGLERVATVVRQYRERYGDRVILLDAGDTSLGTPISGIYHGIPTARMMASMRYDAVALGNHEFNWGKQKMYALTEAMKSEVLCANLVSAQGEPPPYPGYTILERHGVRIAILGLVTPDTYRKAPADATRGWEFLDPTQATRQLLPTMEDSDVQIALTHIGVKADRQILRDNPELDLVVGGHNHRALHRELYEGGRAIVQAGCYGQHLGILEIAIDPTKDSLRVLNYQLLPFDQSSPVDEKAHAVLQDISRELRPLLDRRVAKVEKTLARHPQTDPYETPLGNFIADVLRAESGADIALYNRGGVRFDLEAGELTVEGVHKLFPFDDPVVTLELSGEQLWEILCQGTVDGEGPLSASGLKVEFAHQQASRVWIQGEALDFTKSYRLATTKFLAGGGDGMTRLRELKVVKTHPYTRDVVLSYLKKRPLVAPPKMGRIRLVD